LIGEKFFIYLYGIAGGFLYLKKGKPDPSLESKLPLEILLIYVDSRRHGKKISL